MTTPSQPGELLPCPFCGGMPEPVGQALAVGKRWGFSCCEFFFDVRAKTQADAIAAWNRRSSPVGHAQHFKKAEVTSPVDELREALEALRVFKRYGAHRKSCVQMTGKTCSCGFDSAATKAGGIAASRIGKP